LGSLGQNYVLHSSFLHNHALGRHEWNSREREKPGSVLKATHRTRCLHEFCPYHHASPWPPSTLAIDIMTAATYFAGWVAPAPEQTGRPETHAWLASFATSMTRRDDSPGGKKGHSFSCCHLALAPASSLSLSPASLLPQRLPVSRHQSVRQGGGDGTGLIVRMPSIHPCIPHTHIFKEAWKV
jgi:hypothetical protein